MRLMCAGHGKGQVRPLPSRSDEGTIDTTNQNTDVDPNNVVLSDKPMLEAVVLAEKEREEESSSTRVERWKRKLLDLSMRNRLLNFKECKSNIHVLYPNISELENSIAEGRPFKVHPRPKEMDGVDVRDPEVHIKRTGQDAINELLKEELKSHRLRVDLPEVELSKRLTEIFRKSKLSIEESGVNTLYLALGFLSWYEAKTSEVRHLSPLIMVPLTITRTSIQEGYSISLGDEEPMINVTLLEQLANDFDIVIPEIELIQGDESGLNVNGILNTFRKAVKQVDRWEIVEDAYIGHFSFAKFLMWRDLQVRSEDLQRNKVVAHLMNTPNLQFEGQGEFPSVDTLDREYPPHETFCPISADSSQLAAVCASGEGRSFVLHGPPGTGKSQTITNIIAHNLAMGKTVLFVSEKKAALEVVYDRLKKCDLGPFCLVLHSNKSNKVEFLSQLRQSLLVEEQMTGSGWMGGTSQIQKLRIELNSYVTSLHKVRSTGESVFNGISHLIKLHGYPHIDLKLLGSGPLDKERKDRLSDLATLLQLAATCITHPKDNVWATTDYPDWSNTLTNKIVESLNVGARCCTQLEGASLEVSGHLGLPTRGWSWDTHCAASGVAADLIELLPGVPSSTMMVGLNEAMESEIATWVTAGRCRDALRSKVFSAFAPELLSMDLPSLQLSVTAAYSSWITPELVSRLPKDGRSDWTADLGSEVIEPLGSLEKACLSAKRAVSEVSEPLKIRIESLKLAHMALLAELFDNLQGPPSIPVGALLSAQDWDAYRIATADLVKHGRERDNLRKALLSNYTGGIVKLELEEIRRDLVACKDSWFLPRALGYGKAKKKVREACRGRIPEIDRLLSDLDMAIQLREEEAKVAKYGTMAKELFGAHWKEGEADWDAFESAAVYCDKLKASINKICRTIGQEPSSIRSRVLDILTNDRDRLAKDGDIGQKLRSASISLKELSSELEEEMTVLSEVSTAKWKVGTIDDVIADVRSWRGQFSTILSLRKVAKKRSDARVHRVAWHY